MVYRWRLYLLIFQGHAMENSFVGPRAKPLGETAVEGPGTGGQSVSAFWDQPAHGVQVEAAVSGRGAAWIEEPVASAQALALVKFPDAGCRRSGGCGAVSPIGVGKRFGRIWGRATGGSGCPPCEPLRVTCNAGNGRGGGASVRPKVQP